MLRLNHYLIVFFAIFLLCSPVNAVVLFKVSQDLGLFVHEDFVNRNASQNEACRVDSEASYSHVPANCLEDLGRYLYEELDGPQMLELELFVKGPEVSPILAIYYKSVISGNQDFLHKFSLPEGHRGYLKIQIALPNLDFSRSGFIQFGAQGHRRPFEQLQNLSRGWSAHLGQALCWNQGKDSYRTALGQQNGIGIISMSLREIDSERFKVWDSPKVKFPQWIFWLIFTGSILLVILEKQKIRQKILILFLGPVLLIFLYMQSHIQSLTQEERVNSEIEIQNRLKNRLQMAQEYRGHINSKMQSQSQVYLHKLQSIIEDSDRLLSIEALIKQKYQEYSELLLSSSDMGPLADKLEYKFLQARQKLISGYPEAQQHCARPGLSEVRVGRLTPLNDKHSQEEYLTRLVGMEMFSYHPISAILSEMRHLTGMDPIFTNGDLSFTGYHSMKGMIANKTMINLVLMRIIREYSFDQNVMAEDIRKTFVGSEMIEEFEASGLSYRQFDTMLNAAWNFQEMGSVRGHEFRLHTFAVMNDLQNKPWLLWFILGPETLEFHLDEYLKDTLALSDYALIGNSYGPHYHRGQDSSKTVAAFLSHQASGQFVREIKENGEEWIWYGSSISKMPGVVVVIGESLRDLQKKMELVKAGLILLTLVLLVLIFTVIQVVTKAVHHPVMALSKASQKVRQGDYSEDVVINSSDEFSVLGKAFQQILFRLRKSEILLGFLDKTALGGIQETTQTQKVKTTILFCGIFETGLSQKQMEDFVVSVQEEILKELGMVDKFTSTALLSVFFEGQEENALRAALKIREKIFGLSFGIGTATGEVLMGHIGSDGRKDYTVIGDTVNFAARLEMLGKGRKGCSIFCCKNTFMALSDDSKTLFCDRALVHLKGKQEPQEVYEVLC